MKTTQYFAMILLLVLSNLWLYASNTESNRTFDFDFGAKVGYMAPSEKAISETYGGGLLFGADAIIWTQSGLGGGLSIERLGASKDFGDLPDAESIISIVPITISGMFRIKTPTTPVEPYFGLGGGIYFVKEKVKYTSQDLSFILTYSYNAGGLHGLAGIKYNNIIVELKYTRTYVTSEDFVGTSANVGGINILAGIRF
jgi:hypothetical protein